jgi:hypothetical protein
MGAATSLPRVCLRILPAGLPLPLALPTLKTIPPVDPFKYDVFDFAEQLARVVVGMIPKPISPELRSAFSLIEMNRTAGNGFQEAETGSTETRETAHKRATRHARPCF